MQTNSHIQKRAKKPVNNWQGNVKAKSNKPKRDDKRKYWEGV